MRFFERYYVLDVPIADSTRYQYERSIRDFVEFHGRDVLLSKLTPDLLNRWIIGRTGKLAAVTLKNRRASILAVWRHADRLEMAPPPVRIRRVAVARRIPVAWTPAELSALVRACEQMGPKGPYLSCLLRVGFECGLRRSDLLSLTADDFNDEGIAVIVQRKTGRGHVVRISAETLEELRTIVSLRWTLNMRTLYYHLRVLCHLAGVRRGTFQQLRRSAATQVELQQPGGASRFLGHSSGALAARYYIDWSQIAVPMSPARIQ